MLRVLYDFFTRGIDMLRCNFVFPGGIPTAPARAARAALAFDPAMTNLAPGRDFARRLSVLLGGPAG
jgi:hypothetical protein